MDQLKALSIRLIHAAILLLAVLVLNFSMMHMAPGDVADTISQSMGGADEAVLERIRADYGLDQPFLVQLGRYVGRVLQFDLGYSFFYNQSVTSLILDRLPATLLLVLSAQIVALLLGVVLGVISARRPNGILSHFVTFFALFGYSAPVFWTGILLLIAFSLKIPLFPVAGMQDVTVEGGFFAHALDIARHLVLPMLTLASIFLALYSRLARATMMEVLGSDYVRTAKAKGLRPRDVVYKHALKNALSPVITLAGLQFSAVVSGAVLVETVFDWPGVGLYATKAIATQDFMPLMGVTLAIGALFVIVNLFVDLAYGLLNPKARYA